MRYKVGDKVVVRHDLIEGETYYMGDGVTHDCVVSAMMPFVGEIVTIQSSPSVASGNKYRIVGSDCWWTDDMFEGHTATLNISIERLLEFL